MSNRFVRIGITSFFLALFATFAFTTGSWDYFRFKVGNYDRETETAAIEDTLRLFSASVAGLYMTGGNLTGLNMFPADATVKRNVFMDIAFNLDQGLILVMDRDRSDVKQVRFIDRNHATAVVDEAWFMQYQNAATRMPRSDKKANMIKVRYYLKKQWSRWIVLFYEVYGRADTIPSMDARFATW